MSQPEPPVAPVQSVFAVPAHISAITLAGGCGESHFPQNGAVDCAACAAVVKEYTFAPAPEAAAAEQAAPSGSGASDSAPAAAGGTELKSPEPAPESPAVPPADAPSPKPKKSDAAPSA